MENEIRNAKGVAQLFAIVKDIARKKLGLEQHGLTVGMSDLGSGSGGFIGAFYNLQANMIILNTRPLEKLRKEQPENENFYIFHLLLHEYVHSLGSYDEQQTRNLVYTISVELFGKSHIITQFSKGLENFTDVLLEPGMPETSATEFVMGIDRENTNYIG